MRKLVLFCLPTAGIVVVGSLILNSAIRRERSHEAPATAKKTADTPAGRYPHSTSVPSLPAARTTIPKYVLNSNRAKELLAKLAQLAPESDSYRIWQLSVELRSLAKADANVMELVLTRLEQADCADDQKMVLLGVVARLGDNLVGKRLSKFIQSEFSEGVRFAAMGALTKATLSVGDALTGNDLSGDPVDLRTHGRGQLFYEDPEIVNMIADLIFTESSPRVLASMLTSLLYQGEEVKPKLLQRVSEFLKSSSDETLVNASVSFLASTKSAQASIEIAQIAVDDARPSVRTNALRALRMHSTDTIFITALAKVVQSEKDPSVLEDGLFHARQLVVDEEESLNGSNQELVRDSRALIEQVAFEHQDPIFRLKGMNALIHIVNESLLSPLVRVVQNDPDGSVRSRAVYLLGELIQTKGATQESAALVGRVLREQMLIDKSVDVQKSIKSIIGGN